jgi:hypothetical protein
VTTLHQQATLAAIAGLCSGPGVPDPAGTVARALAIADELCRVEGDRISAGISNAAIRKVWDESRQPPAPLSSGPDAVEHPDGGSMRKGRRQ